MADLRRCSQSRTWWGTSRAVRVAVAEGRGRAASQAAAVAEVQGLWAAVWDGVGGAAAEGW